MGPLQELKKGCETLREHLVTGRLASEAEVAACYPGGDENSQKGLKGWARAYGLLTGLARLKVATKVHGHTADAAAKRAAVLDAIAETPEVVELVARDEDGTPRTLTVYQKGDVALRAIHGLNVVLASLVDDYAVITTHGSQDDVEIVKRLLDEQSYHQRVIAWIATTKGPGLPFDEGDVRPVVPDALAMLHPLDFYTLAQAFQRVNVAGFAALESSTAPKSRPDWSVFWSGMEEVSGVPAPRLMRDRGLLSLVATASERARGHEDARKQAERESKHKRAG